MTVTMLERMVVNAWGRTRGFEREMKIREEVEVE
jgi:hypothetical protein